MECQGGAVFFCGGGGGWRRKRIHPRHPPLPRLPPSPRLWRTSRRASKAVGVWQAEQGKVVGGLGRNGLPSWHAAPVACGYTDRRGTGAPRYEGPFWRHPGAEAPEPVRKRRGALTLRGQRGSLRRFNRRILPHFHETGFSWFGDDAPQRGACDGIGGSAVVAGRLV